MPAAGFAELSLASRYLTLDRNVNHLAIDNFSVQTPGHLTQTGSSYHTLLEGNLVKIYSRSFDTDEWILHSEGAFNESLLK